MSLSPFTLRVIEIVKAIPRGKVMTYGLVAEQAGNRRAARQVVRILHTQTRKHGLPWYRIVNARGEIALKDELARAEQAALLREEGVEVDEHGRMNLEQYLYFHPHN
jgi:methylated-DNA-protein-cysteine methyltransferase-like protein